MRTPTRCAHASCVVRPPRSPVLCPRECRGVFRLLDDLTVGERAFSSGEYTSGLDLRDEDIVVDQPAAAYVTLLFGVDFSAKMQILSIASLHLTELFAGDTAREQLLARPATKDGERIMRNMGLAALQLPDSKVWSVGLEEVLSRLASGPR